MKLIVLILSVMFIMPVANAAEKINYWCTITDSNEIPLSIRNGLRIIEPPSEVSITIIRPYFSSINENKVTINGFPSHEEEFQDITFYRTSIRYTKKHIMDTKINLRSGKGIYPSNIMYHDGSVYLSTDIDPRTFFDFLYGEAYPRDFFAQLKYEAGDYNLDRTSAANYSCVANGGSI